MPKGGKRPGAGRPKKGNVLIQAYVSPEDKRLIADMAGDIGITPGEIIHELCETFKEVAAR